MLMSPELKGSQSCSFPTPCRGARVEEFVRELNEKWSAFERKPLIPIESEDIPKLGFRRFSEEAKEPWWPMKRHEYWSLLYRRRPYLRQLSEDDLLEFGAKALEEIGARFIKGAPKTPMEEMEPMMIRWSHFLDEAHHRALDLRKLVKKADELGDRMEALYQRYQAQNKDEGSAGS